MPRDDSSFRAPQARTHRRTTVCRRKNSTEGCYGRRWSGGESEFLHPIQDASDGEEGPIGGRGQRPELGIAHLLRLRTPAPPLRRLPNHHVLRAVVC